MYRVYQYCATGEIVLCSEFSSVAAATDHATHLEENWSGPYGATFVVHNGRIVGVDYRNYDESAGSVLTGRELD